MLLLRCDQNHRNQVPTAVSTGIASAVSSCLLDAKPNNCRYAETERYELRCGRIIESQGLDCYPFNAHSTQYRS